MTSTAVPAAAMTLLLENFNFISRKVRNFSPHFLPDPVNIPPRSAKTAGAVRVRGLRGKEIYLRGLVLEYELVIGDVNDNRAVFVDFLCQNVF